jgi:hypothetical protein
MLPASAGQVDPSVCQPEKAGAHAADERPTLLTLARHVTRFDS